MVQIHRYYQVCFLFHLWFYCSWIEFLLGLSEILPLILFIHLIFNFLEAENDGKFGQLEIVFRNHWNIWCTAAFGSSLVLVCGVCLNFWVNELSKYSVVNNLLITLVRISACKCLNTCQQILFSLLSFQNCSILNFLNPYIKHNLCIIKHIMFELSLAN